MALVKLGKRRCWDEWRESNDNHQTRNYRPSLQNTEMKPTILALIIKNRWTHGERQVAALGVRIGWKGGVEYVFLYNSQ